MVVVANEFICAVRAFAGLQGESEIETLFFQSYSLLVDGDGFVFK
jgi:hypothetical protein